MKSFKISIPDEWLKKMTKETGAMRHFCPAFTFQLWLEQQLREVESGEIPSTVFLGKTTCPECAEWQKNHKVKPE